MLEQTTPAVLGQGPQSDATPHGEDSANSMGDGLLSLADARYHEFLLVPARHFVSWIIAMSFMQCFCRSSSIDCP